MKQITINLFSFEELSKQAQEEAVNEHTNFLLEVDEDLDNITEEEVIENILINEYLFFENGELANITQYTGKHEKAGTIEFKLFGSTYKVQ